MDKVVFEIMESYNSYLQNLIAGCSEIATKLYSDNIADGLSLILQFSEGASWLIEVNKKLSQLGYINELNHETIQVFLNEINSGLENRDFVLVADLFEYEIKPFFVNGKPYTLEA